MIRSQPKIAGAVLIVLLGVTACSGGATPTDSTGTTIPSTAAASASQPASAVLLEFVNALREGRYDDLAPLVDESHVVVMAAVESADPSLLPGASEGGEIDPQIRRNFWSSLTSVVPGLAPDAGPLRLSEPFVVAVDVDGAQVDFTVISATTDAGPAGEWVLRSDPERGWIVDPVASVGGPFVLPLTQWLGELRGEDRERVVNAIRAQEASWRALAERQPLDEPGVAIGLALEELLAEMER